MTPRLYSYLPLPEIAPERIALLNDLWEYVFAALLQWEPEEFEEWRKTHGVGAETMKEFKAQLQKRKAEFEAQEASPTSDADQTAALLTMRVWHCAEFAFRYLSQAHRLEKADWPTFARKYGEAASFLGRLNELAVLANGNGLNAIVRSAAIRDTARRAGQQSASVRKRNSRVPSQDVLREQAAALMKDGRPARSIAAILAQRHGCTADNIRKRMNAVNSAT